MKNTIKLSSSLLDSSAGTMLLTIARYHFLSLENWAKTRSPAQIHTQAYHGIHFLASNPELSTHSKLSQTMLLQVTSNLVGSWSRRTVCLNSGQHESVLITRYHSLKFCYDKSGITGGKTIRMVTLRHSMQNKNHSHVVAKRQ